MYLCAIIDLHTRYVAGWGISNTMTAEWCTEIVQDAISLHGKPEIINSDQGSQFTSEIYIELLKKIDIQISMDGKGRAIDNIFIERLWRTVKYEHIYLHVYEDGLTLYKGLNTYFKFYNGERRHQSLNTGRSLFKASSLRWIIACRRACALKKMIAVDSLILLCLNWQSSFFKARTIVS